MNRMLDSSLLDCFGVISCGVESFQSCCGKSASFGEFGHSLHAGNCRDGHDASHDGKIDSFEITSIPVVQEVVVVEKELGANVTKTITQSMLDDSESITKESDASTMIL